MEPTAQTPRGGTRSPHPSGRGAKKDGAAPTWANCSPVAPGDTRHFPSLHSLSFFHSFSDQTVFSQPAPAGLPTSSARVSERETLQPPTPARWRLRGVGREAPARTTGEAPARLGGGAGRDKCSAGSAGVRRRLRPGRVRAGLGHPVAFWPGALDPGREVPPTETAVFAGCARRLSRAPGVEPSAAAELF